MKSTGQSERSEQPRGQYAAFISYRHVRADRKWAIWLHRTLETYRVPGKVVLPGSRRRIGRVFRDEEELSASADLTKEIETALDNSSYLIVVCSRATPMSRWVNAEITRFREMGRGDRILALLTDGEPAEAFPDALRQERDVDTAREAGTATELVTLEPLASDARPKPDESWRGVRQLAFLRIAAPILGCSFDDLRQRDAERRTGQLQLALSLALGISIVLLGLIGWALAERNRASANATLARKEAHRATAAEADAIEKRKRAEAAEQTAKNRLRDAQWQLYRQSITLAEARLYEGDPLNAETILHNAPREPRNWEWSYLKFRCLSAPKSQTINFPQPKLPQATRASIDFDRNRQVEIKYGVQQLTPVHIGARWEFFYSHLVVFGLRDIVFSAEGRYGAPIAQASIRYPFVAYDFEGGGYMKVEDCPLPVSAAGFGAAGSLLAAAHTNGIVRLFTTSGNGRWTSRATIAATHGKEIQSLAVSPDGTSLLICDEDNGASVCESATGRVICVLSIQNTRRLPEYPDPFHIPHRFLFSDNGSCLAAITSFGVLLVWDVSTGRLLLDRALPPTKQGPRSYLFRFIDARRLWVGGRRPQIVSTDGGVVQQKALLAEKYHCLASAVSSDGNLWYGAIAESNRIDSVVLSMHGGRVVSRFRYAKGLPECAAFSPDSKRVVVYERMVQRNYCVLRDVGSGEEVLSVEVPNFYQVSDVVFSPSGSHLLLKGMLGEDRPFVIIMSAPQWPESDAPREDNVNKTANRLAETDQ